MPWGMTRVLQHQHSAEMGCPKTILHMGLQWCAAPGSSFSKLKVGCTWNALSATYTLPSFLSSQKVTAPMAPSTTEWEELLNTGQKAPQQQPCCCSTCNRQRHSWTDVRTCPPVTCQQGNVGCYVPELLAAVSVLFGFKSQRPVYRELSPEHKPHTYPTAQLDSQARARSLRGFCKQRD